MRRRNLEKKGKPNQKFVQNKEQNKILSIILKIFKQQERRSVSPRRPNLSQTKTGPVKDKLSLGFKEHKNAVEAVKSDRNEANVGNAAAMTNLGYCLQNGMGVAKDDCMALKWYKKAADNYLELKNDNYYQKIIEVIGAIIMPKWRGAQTPEARLKLVSALVENGFIPVDFAFKDGDNYKQSLRKLADSTKEPNLLDYVYSRPGGRKPLLPSEGESKLGAPQNVPLQLPDILKGVKLQSPAVLLGLWVANMERNTHNLPYRVFVRNIPDKPKLFLLKETAFLELDGDVEISGTGQQATWRKKELAKAGNNSEEAANTAVAYGPNGIPFEHRIIDKIIAFIGGGKSNGSRGSYFAAYEVEKARLAQSNSADTSLVRK